jgi:hypothetical protein
MVEGNRATIEDETDAIVQRVHDIASRDPKRPDTLFRKHRVARDIPFRIVSHIMRDTVDLDRKPRHRAIEIEHKRADGMLSAKPKSVRSGAQDCP